LVSNSTDAIKNNYTTLNTLCQQTFCNRKELNMDIDSIEHHIRTLDNQHTTIARKLDALLSQKSWDEFEVENLKKQKLKLKDELSIMYRKRYDLMNEHHYD